MGMFDEIICDYPLPDNPPEWIRKAVFQTKDFENLLDTYVITDTGRLIRHCKEYETVEDKSHPFGFYLHPVKEWEEDTEYHGDLVFYTGNVTSRDKDGTCTVRQGTGDQPLFVEYKARFTEGQLQWIRRLSDASR